MIEGLFYGACIGAVGMMAVFATLCFMRGFVEGVKDTVEEEAMRRMYEIEEELDAQTEDYVSD